MIRPSDKAAQLAEELVDYVHPGMNRAAAIEEVADMVDEMNSDLVAAVESLLAQLESDGTSRNAVLRHHLAEILQNYRPLRLDATEQHELFSSNTTTKTGDVPVAGQMP